MVNHDSGMHSDLDRLFKENNIHFVIDEVGNGNDALKKIVSSNYDLLMLNLMMPDTDMLGLIGKLKEVRRDLPVLTFSLQMEYTLIKRYLTSGVNGYCFYKAGETGEICKAIRTILSGKWYISPEIVELIVEDALYSKKTDRLDALTEREFEVFTHLVKDETPAVIAEILSVHTSTVALYKSRIMDKLRVTNLVDMKNMMKVPSMA